MTNLLLYKKVIQLKDFLENHELDDYSVKKLKDSEQHIIDIFRILERRRG